MCERNMTPSEKPEIDMAANHPRSSESTHVPPTEEQQVEYLAAYRLQLRRMACPGCGDDEPVF